MSRRATAKHPYVATVCVRVEVPFEVEADADPRSLWPGGALPGQAGARERAEADAEIGRLEEKRQRAAGRRAEKEIARAVAAAVGKTGKVVGVLVEEVRPG